MKTFEEVDSIEIERTTAGWKVSLCSNTQDDEHTKFFRSYTLMLDFLADVKRGHSLIRSL
jgi:hypothetical protein